MSAPRVTAVSSAFVKGRHVVSVVGVYGEGESTIFQNLGNGFQLSAWDGLFIPCKKPAERLADSGQSAFGAVVVCAFLSDIALPITIDEFPAPRTA